MENERYDVVLVPTTLFTDGCMSLKLIGKNDVEKRVACISADRSLQRLQLTATVPTLNGLWIASSNNVWWVGGGWWVHETTSV